MCKHRLSPLQNARLVVCSLSALSLLSLLVSALSYANSPLRSVQVKVEEVKEVMQNSVARALSSVETLEDMDEKAELFEDQSKKFHKRAEEVKVQERSKYRKLTCLIATVALIVLAYFVVPALIDYKSDAQTQQEARI